MRKEVADPNWKEEFIASANDNNIEGLWGTLKSRFIQLRDMFVPITKSSAKPSWKKLGGFPRQKTSRMLCANKDATHRNWICAKKRDTVDLSRLEYTKARNKVKKLMPQARRNFESDVAESEDQSKSFLVSH